MSSPLLIPVGYQFFDNAGKPLAGGSLTTYAAGTSSPLATYSDDGLSVLNPNPIPLNSAGRCVASGTEINVYPSSASYKLVLADSGGTVLWTHDNIDPAAPFNIVTTLSFPATVAGGTSGGVPYFSAPTTLTSSAALAANAPVIGGGPGTAPSTITAGTLGQVLGGTATAPVFLGGATLLHAGQGTSTAAAATTVDSVVLPALTALDFLFIVFQVESVTQTTAAATLFSVTDGSTITTISGSITAGSGSGGMTMLSQRQGNTTNYVFTTQAVVLAGGSRVDGMNLYSATAAWTSGWTLGLRHGGVTAGGTFKYGWQVYRMAGQ